MTNLRLAGLLAAFLVVASISDGQPVHDTVLQPLGFLSGRWVSETPAEMQEEIWTPVRGDSMIGSFRILQHGRPVFYEFWVVEVDDNRPVLKLKHFNAGLLGWEEKNATTKMPLISTAESDAVFAEADGSVSLHYHLVGKKLTCTVHHVKNSKSTDETFTLMRAPRD
jgi:Domain of unknown function (DUF6265)